MRSFWDRSLWSGKKESKMANNPEIYHVIYDRMTEILTRKDGEGELVFIERCRKNIELCEANYNSHSISEDKTFIRKYVDTWLENHTLPAMKAQRRLDILQKQKGSQVSNDKPERDVMIGKPANLDQDLNTMKALEDTAAPVKAEAVGVRSL